MQWLITPSSIFGQGFNPLTFGQQNIWRTESLLLPEKLPLTPSGKIKEVPALELAEWVVNGLEKNARNNWALKKCWIITILDGMEDVRKTIPGQLKSKSNFLEESDWTWRKFSNTKTNLFDIHIFLSVCKCYKLLKKASLNKSLMKYIKSSRCNYWIQVPVMQFILCNKCIKCPQEMALHLRKIYKS